MLKIEVQEHSLYDFLKTTQSLFEKGYRFDFEKNENVPVTYGTLIVANMFKEPEVVIAPAPVVEPAVEPVKETAEPAKVPDEVPAELPDEVPADVPTTGRKSTKAVKT